MAELKKIDKIKDALDEVAQNQVANDVAPILRINAALALLQVRELERIANALEKIAGGK